jgi:hypothetical protein
LVLTSKVSAGLSTDFSVTNNLNGAWFYGWATSAVGQFTLLESHTPPAGLPASAAIQFWTTASAYSVLVAKNIGTSTVLFNGTANYLSGAVVIHPGPAGQVAISRWTAPSAGTYLVNATFFRSDSGTTVVHLRRNGVSIFSAVLSNSRQSTNTSKAVGLSAGDTVDFVVGDGGNGYTFDSVLVTANISLLGSALSGTLSIANTPESTLFTAPAGASNCTFNASGTWKFGQDPSQVTSPDGVTNFNGEGFGYTRILPSANWFALLAKTGSSFQLIGASKTLNVSAGQSVTLLMNEAAQTGAYLDNSGSLPVSYQCQ